MMLNTKKVATKIIGTIGPASERPDVIQAMILEGMAAARLNFSHGDHAAHQKNFTTIREVSSKLKQPIAVIQDLQGPKIRVGRMPNGKIELLERQIYALTLDQSAPPEESIPVDIGPFQRNVSEGQRILFADGHLEGRVVSVSGDAVMIEMTLGGTLKENQGINVPGIEWDIPSLTDKDRQDLAFGLSLGVDAIAVSFVRTAQDIHSIRDQILEFRPDRVAIPLIAKLERPTALKNLGEILDASDGVMVARGDLGVEMPPEEVPVAQKTIIEAANSEEKIVITATQMLESMIQNPRPTRAEASDVANAIFDGTDAVMLSGETAVGKYPIEAVRIMREIVTEAELHLSRWGRSGNVAPGENEDGTLYATRAAVELAQDPRVKAIAVFSQTGRTARLMSKARPKVPIFGFTSERPIFHRMQLEWGVTPHRIGPVSDFEMMISLLETTILEEKMLEVGDHVVVVCGFPVGESKPPNLTVLYAIGHGQAGSGQA